MTPYYSDEWLTILQGDVREVLPTLPAESVDCIVTSPPYWGLRDYDNDGQIGLERTPEEYVANLIGVFRELRRVLKPSGTCWLNLGDSYASTKEGNTNGLGSSTLGAAKGAGSMLAAQRLGEQVSAANVARKSSVPSGLKPKDLVGVPWRVAFALQQPYYVGNIKREVDRAWLAAMIDGEGSIDINRLKAGRRPRESFGAYVRVHNTSEAVVRRCAELAGVGSVKVSEEREGRQRVYVWATYGDNARMVLREVYPYLIAKQQQARLAAHPSDETCAAIRLLHHGTETTIDCPAPESALEPGWYLRSDIIWSKPNPMPESVTDRPTKAHEYLFLLTRSPRYFFDADAVREVAVRPGDVQTFGGAKARDAEPIPVDDPRYRNGKEQWGRTIESGLNGRNLRSVWTIATRPYPGAHFAVFPPELPERCIKAGSPELGTVLDPFAGSGTTGMVANRLSRRAILIDLNGDYLKQQLQRNAQTPLGLGAA